MKASTLGKRVLSSVFYSSGFLARRLKDEAKDGLLILMYHRVVDGIVARALSQDGMYVDVETFGEHLRFVMQHFRVVSLAEGLDILEQEPGAITRRGRALCAITFDDGWRDVHENAYPLLRAHGISATVFLPTEFIGTRKWFWTDRLARLLNSANPGEIERTVQTLSGFSLPTSGLPGETDGRGIHGIIEAMKKLPQEEIERILGTLSEYRGAAPIPEQRAFLSWEEVREMSRSGIFQFGSHTESHRILTTLSDDEVTVELNRSKERLVAEGVVDPAFVPFAYPNGNHTDRIAVMVSEAGYRLAVTTQRGWNRTKPNLDAYRLKRIGVHQDIASTDAMFCCRLAEIF